jgi:hypothetical protein
MLKISMILTALALTTSASSFAAGNHPPSHVIERLLAEIEANYQVTCQGDEFVRCLHADGREITLDFTREAENEFSLNIIVNGQEIQDLALMRLSRGLVAEIASLEADSEFEVDEGADEVLPGEFAAEQNPVELQQKVGEQKQATQKTPTTVQFKRIKFRKPNESNPQARLPRMNHRPLGCPVGPRLKHGSVRLKHTPRSSPAKRAGK